MPWQKKVRDKLSKKRYGTGTVPVRRYCTGTGTSREGGTTGEGFLPRPFSARHTTADPGEVLSVCGRRTHTVLTHIRTAAASSSTQIVWGANFVLFAKSSFRFTCVLCGLIWCARLHAAVLLACGARASGIGYAAYAPGSARVCAVGWGAARRKSS